MTDQSVSGQSVNALVVLGTLTPAIVYGTDGGVDAVLDKIRAEVSTTKRDVSTPAGRKQIASIAYRIARSKTLLDDMGKDLVSGLKAQTGKIDKERKRIRDELDALGEEFRKPLTDFEAREKTRVSEHEAAIADLASYGRNIPRSASAIAAVIEKAQSFGSNRDWQEFADRATETRSIVLEDLRAAHDQAIAREAAEAEAERQRQEEIARQQREREERLRAEAAEQARIEAERKAAAEAEAVATQARREREEIEARARAEREARERAEQEKAEAEARARRAEDERIAAARRAEEERIAADLRAKREAEIAARRAEMDRLQAIDDERRRVEDERKREADAAARREADRKHRGAINAAARDALVAGGLSVDAATTAIRLIAERKVPAVAISY